MKINLKKILQKCIAQNVEFVLIHKGFINNCKLTDIEYSYLQLLAEELKSDAIVITFDDIALTPYITSYNGGVVLAGIKFNKIEKWN